VLAEEGGALPPGIKKEPSERQSSIREGCERLRSSNCISILRIQYIKNVIKEVPGVLYILQIALMIIWVGWLMKFKRVTWSAVVNTYVFTLLVVDIIEIILNLLLNLYKFPTHLLANPVHDNFLGILFTDSVILPLTSIAFCYHVRHHAWRVVLAFTFLMSILEWVYLKLGFLTYNNWAVAYSTMSYLAGFAIFSRLGHVYIDRTSDVPYWIRLTCFGYFALVLPGAIPDVLFDLHQWRLGLLASAPSDDRVADLGSCFIFSILAGTIIAITPERYKRIWFAVLACLTLVFAFYAYGQGWLIYNHWNHFLTVVRYLVPYVILYAYDRWQTKLKERFA